MHKLLWLLFVFINSSTVYSDEVGDKKTVALRIASAANFYPTLKKITKNYEASSNNKITIIRGSTGKLYAQIVRGAPYDIFFSADSVRIDKLVEQGKTIDYENNKSSFVYAIGALALWKPNANNSQQLEKLLKSGKFNKLAIANPKIAPYGRASIEALKALNIYKVVKQKLVYGENIAQVMQFVQSGAADIGLLAKSYISQDNAWDISSRYHNPIKQKVAILKQSQKKEIAKDFLQYFNRPEIQNMIKNDGYKI